VLLVHHVRRRQVVLVGKHHCMRDVHTVQSMAGRADGMKRPSWPANETVLSVSCSAASVQDPELFNKPIGGRCSEPPESNKAVYRQYPLMAGTTNSRTATTPVVGRRS